MANMSKLLLGTKSLSATKDDPRKSWEFYNLPPSLRKETRTQKKRNLSIQKLLSIILDNAFKLP